MKKLTKSELKEHMYVTWGRIRMIAGNSPHGKVEFDKERLMLLVEKFNIDMANAQVIEK